MAGWVSVTAAVAVLGLAGTGAARAQAAPGGYGGGLIEYLMTGGAMGAPRAGDRFQQAPRQAPPPGPGRMAAYAPAPAPPGAYARYPDGDPYSGGAPEAGMPRVSPAPPTGARGYDEAGIGRALDPRYERQVVPYPSARAPGSIVIDTQARHLYLVQPGGQAIRYGIGVGRPGFLWTGAKTVSRKEEWPGWTPPPEMLARRPDLPRHMDGGPANPLGARALYLGSSLYRIHGTNEPHTIGQAVSSGCIRMMNEDVIDLYARTRVGARVDVL